MALYTSGAVRALYAASQANNADPAALREVTRHAAVGIMLLENIGLSDYYSLANKFFDYLHAAVPMVVTDLQLLGPLVRDRKLFPLEEAVRRRGQSDADPIPVLVSAAAERVGPSVRSRMPSSIRRSIARIKGRQ